MFLGLEYSENNESYNVNDDNVASLPNLEDVSKRSSANRAIGMERNVIFKILKMFFS
jgi:hypothetical protein